MLDRGRGEMMEHAGSSGVGLHSSTFVSTTLDRSRSVKKIDENAVSIFFFQGSLCAANQASITA